MNYGIPNQGYPQPFNNYPVVENQYPIQNEQYFPMDGQAYPMGVQSVQSYPMDGINGYPSYAEAIPNVGQNQYPVQVITKFLNVYVFLFMFICMGKDFKNFTLKEKNI